MLTGYAKAGQSLKISDTTSMLNPYAFKRTPVSVTRPFNTSFQVSTTRFASVRYSIEISCTLSTGGGQSADAILEISPDNTNWTETGRYSINLGGLMGLTLTVSNTNTGQIMADVPEGYYVRIRTITSGGGTVTYKSGQETY